MPSGTTPATGRVKGWRADIRVRWRFRRFRSGPQSGSHRLVSSPCSPNPACRFPAPGSPVGSCASYTDRRAIRACRWSDSPTSSAAATRRPLYIPSRVRRAVEPVHASTTSNLSGSTPSLMHVMLPESLRQSRGPGIATPARLLPSDIPPHLRPLSSTGITRRLQSYGPLRHPDGPACPSRGSGWCVHTTDRASRVATSSLFHTCRRHYPGGNGPVRLSLLFPAVVGLPLFSAGSASALLFSRPAQRSLSLRPVWSLNRPRRPFDTRVLRPTSLPP